MSDAASEFSPMLCCPSCTNIVAVKVLRRYNNALGAARVVIECPTCTCFWTEHAEDVFPEKEAVPCPLPN